MSLRCLVVQEMKARGLDSTSQDDQQRFCDMALELGMVNGIPIEILQSVLRGEMINMLWLGQFSQLIYRPDRIDRYTVDELYEIQQQECEDSLLRNPEQLN
jgi:hypothetical protein